MCIYDVQLQTNVCFYSCVYLYVCIRVVISCNEFSLRTRGDRLKIFHVLYCLSVFQIQSIHYPLSRSGLFIIKHRCMETFRLTRVTWNFFDVNFIVNYWFPFLFAVIVLPGRFVGKILLNEHINITNES